MDQKRRFFDAADAVVGEGRTPTLEAVRERLGGGSFSTLGPLYDAWSKSRGHHPRPTRKDLPTYLIDRLATVAAEIWCEGRRDHANEDKQERDEIARERDHLRSELKAARSLVDALERRLRQENEIVEVTSTQAPPQVSQPFKTASKVPPRRGRSNVGAGTAMVLTDGFWDITMQDVHVMLDRESMTATEILSALRDETRAEATYRDRAFGPGRLADRLRKKPKLFAEAERHVFCRRDQLTAGPTSPGNANEPRPVSTRIDLTEDAEPKWCKAEAAEAFWTSVMQEVLDMLGRNTLSFSHLFNGLNEDTTKAAVRRDKAWSPGRLAYKMRKKPDLFTDLGNGLFCQSAQSLDESGRRSAA